tara:strand:+ start:430 stop:675 length:246 start_codon:yes stop_codon:yes gene_type:complete
MKITKNRLKQLIEQEVKSVLEDNTEELDEGFEHITPENIGYAIEALKQMGITFSPIVAGATVMGIYDLVKDKLTKPDAEDE